MTKVRLILAAVLMAMLPAAYWSFSMAGTAGAPSQLIFGLFMVAFLLTLGGIPALLAMLVSTFFRVETDGEGRLCYDPANPYWRLMKRIWKGAWTNPVSLCKSFWMTFGVVWGTYLAVLMGSVVVLVWYEVHTEGWGWLLAGLHRMMPFIYFMGGLMLLGILSDLLEKLHPALGRIARKVAAGIICAGGLALYGYMAWYIITAPQGREKSIEFVWIIVTSFGVFGGFVLLYKIALKLRNTVLGKFIETRLIQKYCPPLYARQAEPQTQ